MKKLFLLGIVWVALVTVGRAAEAVFTKAVAKADFFAAGLGKLSSEELARLDGLVRDYQSGALAAARRDAAAAAEARVLAEARRAEGASVARAQSEAGGEKTTKGGPLARAKVLLAPGTEIEYAAVESRIAGNFTGWDGRAVLTLENGQRWQIANGGNYSTPPLLSPQVKITPAPLGGFWMTIEGVTMRVKVLPFGAK
jgi:hypothetical protein